MRKALVIGIDSYANVSNLHGCVNDSFAVKVMLDRHTDGSVNFGVMHLAASSATDQIGRQDLRDAIEALFSGDGEVLRRRLAPSISPRALAAGPYCIPKP